MSHYTTLTAWKFHSTMQFLFVLFKVNAFPFKNKDKSQIFHAKATFTLCSAAPCFFCFVLKQSVTVYFFKLNCFKLIGWFYHHNVFPAIRSVCYRFLHCCYRFLHCCYRFLHCCLGLNALKPTNHSRVIFLCVLLASKNQDNTFMLKNYCIQSIAFLHVRTTYYYSYQSRLTARHVKHVLWHKSPSFHISRKQILAI
jgi:hypothetical protein